MSKASFQGKLLIFVFTEILYFYKNHLPETQYIFDLVQFLVLYKYFSIIRIKSNGKNWGSTIHPLLKSVIQNLILTMGSNEMKQLIFWICHSWWLDVQKAHLCKALHGKHRWKVGWNRIRLKEHMTKFLHSAPYSFSFLDSSSIAVLIFRPLWLFLYSLLCNVYPPGCHPSRPGHKLYGTRILH